MIQQLSSAPFGREEEASPIFLKYIANKYSLPLNELQEDARKSVLFPEIPTLRSIDDKFYLTDTLADFQPEHLKKVGITHVVAILPSSRELDAIRHRFEGIPYTLHEYGYTHQPSIPKKEYDTILHPLSFDKVLVVCNAGYQRSLPFIMYAYMRMLNMSPTDACRKVLRATFGEIDNNVVEAIVKLIS